MTREERIASKVVRAASGFGWKFFKVTNRGVELAINRRIQDNIIIEDDVSDCRDTAMRQVYNDLMKVKKAGLFINMSSVRMGIGSLQVSGGRLEYEANVSVEWDSFMETLPTLSGVERIFGEAGVNVD